MLRSGSSWEVEGVQTTKSTLYGKAIVVAAGSWSGSLMHDLLRDSNIQLYVPIKPRKVRLQCELISSWIPLRFFYFFCQICIDTAIG